MDEELKGLRDLRKYISRAREACAGSNTRQLSEVRRLVNEACKRARELRYETIAGALSVIWHILLHAKTYGDRLAPDRTLCDILNGLDKKIEGLESDLYRG